MKSKMKKQGISRYKLNKLASEALRNSLRLHFDSILLFNNESYPSAFQLSVLALEELSKAKWIDHYMWSSETNEGYPHEEFEMKWLKLLYLHPEKQWNYVGREYFDYSPKFFKLVESGGLERKKQNAVYVGFDRKKGKIDISGRISTPFKITKKDAVQVISLINDDFLSICKCIEEYEWCFDGARKMDDVFDYGIFFKLLKWPNKSGIKNAGWWKRNRKSN